MKRGDVFTKVFSICHYTSFVHIEFFGIHPGYDQVTIYWGVRGRAHRETDESICCGCINCLNPFLLALDWWYLDWVHCLHYRKIYKDHVAWSFVDKLEIALALCHCQFEYGNNTRCSAQQAHCRLLDQSIYPIGGWLL